MRKTLLAVLLIGLVATGIAAAQGSDQAKEQALSKLEAPDVLAAPATEAAQPKEAAPEQPAEKIVKLIEIVGNKSISSNTIISKIKTRTGSPYSDNIVSDDIKRLYLLGYFSDIKIDKQDYKDGLKIIITVVERPIIDKISFESMKHIYTTEKKLKDSLKSKEKQYLDYPSLKEDTDTIKKMYAKKGFNEAVVDYRVEVIEGTNKANVTFVAAENFRFKIRGVFFEGNKSYPPKRLMKVVKTRWAWMFNSGALKDEVLAEDIERLKSFYQREGYADVKVSYTLSRDAKKRAIYVNVKIEEGKKYLVGDVKIDGFSAVSEKDIRAKLTDCASGKVFSQDALKNDVANIQSAYFDRGYIFAGVNNVTSVNPDTGKVDILYTITENNVAYVDKIKVRGNIKTKDVVIRRELRIHPGDKFDGEKLRRSKERLQNLGFFEEVSYDTEGGEGTDKRDLVVEVKESKTGSFSFGGGYSTIDSFMGFAEIEQKNFDWRNWPYFTGDGQNLRLRAKIGTISDEYMVSWTDPWIFDYPLAFGFDAFRRRHDRDTDIGYGYNETRTGGDLRFNKELTEYLNGVVMYRYEVIQISDIPTTATQDFQKEAGRNAISSTMFGLTFDRRDSVFNPTKGYLLGASFEVAGGPLGGDKDFRRFIGNGSKFFPLFNGSVIELTGRVGIASPYGKSSEIPIYERFFAGGGDSIRGYEERKVGPFDPLTNDPLGGNSLALGTIEYTYPIFSFFKLAAFMDTGNVWSTADELGSGGFKTAAGFGVRVKTPMGPVKVDYGIPFNKQPGETTRSNGRFNFSVGSGF